MTDKEQRRMHELCMQIAIEKNYTQMVRLVREFKDLLDAQEQRLKPVVRQN